MPKKSPAKNKLPEIITASDFEINIGKILINERYMFDDGYPNNPGLREEIYRIVHNLSFERNLGLSVMPPTKKNQKKNKGLKVGRVSESEVEKMNQLPDLLEELKNNSYLPMIVSGKIYSLLPDITLTPREKDFPLFFSLKLKQYDLHEIDDFLQYHFTNNFSHDLKMFKRFLELCLRQHISLIKNDTSETVKDWIVENSSSINTTIASPPPKTKDSKNFVTPFKWNGTTAHRLELCKKIQSDDVMLIGEIGTYEFSMIFSENPLPFKEVEQRIAWIDIVNRTKNSNLVSLFKFLYFLKGLGLLSDDDFITTSHTDNLYKKIEYFFEDVNGKPFKNIRGANLFSRLTGEEIKNYKYPEGFYKIKDLLFPS